MFSLLAFLAERRIWAAKQQTTADTSGHGAFEAGDAHGSERGCWRAPVALAGRTKKLPGRRFFGEGVAAAGLAAAAAPPAAALSAGSREMSRGWTSAARVTRGSAKSGGPQDFPSQAGLSSQSQPPWHGRW